MAERIDTRDLMFRSDIAAHALFEDLRKNCEEEPEDGIQMIPVGDWLDYVQELIDDTCTGLPPKFEFTRYDGTRVDISDEWPYRHVKIDYEAAAEELKSDYHEVEFGGETYYVK